MTMTMSIEMPDSFSIELRSLLTGLLQRDVHKRLGCRGRGAEEIKSHPFFRGIDWRVVYLQRLTPPLIPARGEVNAADAFDIGSFDDEDTKHIKLTDADQELYRNFPVVVSERWQHEIAETIFDYINHEADKAEMKRKNKNKLGYQEEEEQSDCILHGYVKRLGGTFTATWLTRYVRLYPNRLELWSDTGKQPELIFMDQIEEVCNDFVQIKNEQCIVIKLYNHSKYVLTNSDEIGLKEWHLSLKSAHRESMDMMTTMAEKATKIYGTEIPLKHMGKRRQQLQQEAGGPAPAGAGPSPGGLGSMISGKAAPNWEQKIIQKELQASSTSAAASAAAIGKQPAMQANSTTDKNAPTQAELSGQATTVGSATAASSTRPPGSGPPVTSGGSQHQHHHHHQHHHTKSFDQQQVPGSPAASGPAQSDAKHHRTHRYSGHRAHHHHHRHHHHHHQHAAAAVSAGVAEQTAPVAGAAVGMGGPNAAVATPGARHHHHHHAHHHHAHHHHARSASSSDKAQQVARTSSHRRSHHHRGQQQQQQQQPQQQQRQQVALPVEQEPPRSEKIEAVRVGEDELKRQQQKQQQVAAADVASQTKLANRDKTPPPPLPAANQEVAPSTDKALESPAMDAQLELSDKQVEPRDKVAVEQVELPAPIKEQERKADKAALNEPIVAPTGAPPQLPPPLTTAKEDQENLFSSSSSVESSASGSSQSYSSPSCSSSDAEDDGPPEQTLTTATMAAAAAASVAAATTVSQPLVGSNLAGSTGKRDSAPTLTAGLAVGAELLLLASAGVSSAGSGEGVAPTCPTQAVPVPNERLKLAVSLENVSDQQEVLRDPSKRITSDNKQREQDLVAQYEKLNISARNSASSIEPDESQQQIG